MSKTILAAVRWDKGKKSIDNSVVIPQSFIDAGILLGKLKKDLTPELKTVVERTQMMIMRSKVSDHQMDMYCLKVEDDMKEEAILNFLLMTPDDELKQYKMNTWSGR